ncbi:MAG: ABC-F family ATP-binding cassette domain-containing protein, partial [Clostridiaceae bacterium]|nr:ABC-F family ATP-binding cassette domain-containing protein [Clostridiaceae bacterium]
LDGGRATTFLGNYSAYGEKKAIIRAGIMKAWLNQQQEIKHQEEVITRLRSFNREKSIKRAESREKLLNKMEILDKPTELNDAMNITLEPCVVSGNDVLTVRGLSKRFDNNQLFSNVDFDIRRGERIAIIGNNGTGKTTILKIINGLLSPDEGEIKVGSKVHIGYYDQEHQVLHMEKTIFEEIQDTYPDMNNTQVRNVLAAFLFTGDDVFKRIRDLSGGERGRVSLAKLMLSEANFLILDEPTNHLDITSKEILENALVNYTGTVLYVSHDRYFINKTATRILDLKMGTLLNYIGNYDYYLEKKDAVELAYTSKTASIPAAKRSLTGQQPSSGQGIFIGQKASGQNTVGQNASAASSSGGAAAPVTPEKLDWKQQKEEQARLRKRQNELKKVEESIQNLESRDQEIDTLLCDATVFSDVSRLMQLQKEKEEIAKELETLYETWEELAE